MGGEGAVERRRGGDGGQKVKAIRILSKSWLFSVSCLVYGGNNLKTTKVVIVSGLCCM